MVLAASRPEPPDVRGFYPLLTKVLEDFMIRARGHSYDGIRGFFTQSAATPTTFEVVADFLSYPGLEGTPFDYRGS
jgi:hypothetical protein